ncbi:BON domain-containing protein [Nitrospira sp. MA-1]|nr:BON domain-containing protein [Nitrospira sp. MA-1]
MGIEERIQTDGRMEWGLINEKVTPEKKPLYGEDKTVKPNGLTTDNDDTDSRGTPSSNRMIGMASLTKDRNLRKALWNSLRDVAMLQKDLLHVRAKDGMVTLSGIVEKEPQRVAAGKAAESVSGVKKVINAIHVGRAPLRRTRLSFLKKIRVVCVE